mmetsp:Transcript_68575/g.172776  ORF Transcript_68575/g.172776 Transcript_68575/m.172776 type:complete len:92 (+) Transcript_68575:2527-2802(+)
MTLVGETAADGGPDRIPAAGSVVTVVDLTAEGDNGTPGATRIPGEETTLTVGGEVGTPGAILILGEAGMLGVVAAMGLCVEGKVPDITTRR